MTTTTPERTHDRSELGVSVLLLVLGGLVLWDASQINTGVTQAGAVGPRAVPYLIGGLLLVCAVAQGRVLPGEGGQLADLAVQRVGGVEIVAGVRGIRAQKVVVEVLRHLAGEQRLAGVLVPAGAGGYFAGRRRGKGKDDGES